MVQRETVAHGSARERLDVDFYCADFADAHGTVRAAVPDTSEDHTANRQNGGNKISMSSSPCSPTGSLPNMQPQKSFFLGKPMDSILTFLDNWGATILAVLIVSYLYDKFFSRIGRDKNLICAHCGGRKLEQTSGKGGEFWWIYRNKDESRDARVKDNYQIANYISEWKCTDCGAETKFLHSPEKRPSKKAKVLRRTRIKNGSGERRAEDWQSESSEVISGANRKGQ